MWRGMWVSPLTHVRFGANRHVSHNASCRIECTALNDLTPIYCIHRYSSSNRDSFVGSDSFGAVPGIQLQLSDVNAFLTRGAARTQVHSSSYCHCEHNFAHNFADTRIRIVGIASRHGGFVCQSLPLSDLGAGG